jgi:hypothetical protein
MSNWGIDIDGTIDSFPRLFQTLISDLVHGGNSVYILTGIEQPGPVKPEDVLAKRAYLASLGITDYTDIIVVPIPHDVNKVKAMQDNDIAVLIDNDTRNTKAAKKAGFLSLLVTNSKI